MKCIRCNQDRDVPGDDLCYNCQAELHEEDEELKEHQRGGLAHPYEFIKKK